mmetsp:Transcript_8131/g.23235  ORF Transcript_8131/g.23235 Transcript_8131/m.23235 type:complete len:805 (-) Transcript_8131:79-2493(-)
MSMALPALSARLQPPHKSTLGIFSLLRSEGDSRAVSVASPGGSASARGAPSPLWETGASAGLSASPALPLLVPPLSKASTAKDTSDAATLAPRKPWSPKTKALKDRKVKQAHDQVEIRRALRSLWPGDWNAAEFCTQRQRFAEQGNWGVVSALSEVVAKTTKDALDMRGYRIPPRVEVQLPHRVQDTFFAFASTNATPPEDELSPPLVCSATGPLELLAALRAKQSTNPMVMSFELTDFATDGSVLGLSARSFAQRDMMARTNLEHHIQQAEVEVKGGSNTAEEHLRAASDPYILVAHNVRVFRGSLEQGYPFHSLEDSLNVTMLLSGRHALRPEMSKKGEYFTRERDVIACMDRLHLLGLAGVGAGESYEGPPSSTGPGPRGKPVLIISMHDLTAAAAQQPRHSIAAALKTWRKLYAHMYEAVLVACGDSHTAEILDGQVNSELYASVLNGTWKPDAWHWDTSFLDLSSSGMLARLGTSVQSARHRGQTNEGAEVPSSAKTGRRRSSATNMMLSARVNVIQNLGRDMQDQASGLPTTVWQQAHYDQQQTKLHQRRVSLNLASNPSSIAPSENTTPTGASRRRMMASQDSRSAFERRYQARMADAMLHNSTTMKESESAATAAKSLGMAGAITMALRSDPVASQEAKAEEGIAKLEEQKKIDKNAEMLGMSEAMKASLTRKAAHGDADEEEQQYQKALEEEESKVQDDIQRLAAMFQATQETHLKNRAQRKPALPPGVATRRRSIPSDALAEREKPTPAPEMIGEEPISPRMGPRRSVTQMMMSGAGREAIKRAGTKRLTATAQ